ncbi:MAG: 3-hydroxyacyl-CoA dehydrogenase NAD-binding domain-containing protein [Alphaproteobacteria bacterium]|nr:3-hydroxyacyl-CoA dehydrogenase NAD-binding domain-containing protein [Alphaproteobacteria bacterium]MDD9920201.1 3-hydroxyacyl-CoA dehydrogenase NAD-binding domain-containing protein [Alphaproteobacteria bacterium]
MADIQKVAVIGAGVMGAGIAAQVANAGVDVLLLDIVPEKAKDRDVVAKTAVQKLKKTNPAPLMHPSNAKRIAVGNIEDNLKDIADCDWVVEVVIERLDIKQNLYKKLSKYLKADAVVSSNTSTIPLAELTKGMPQKFKERFCITHFFNPPRYLRLLEVVTGPDTKPELVERVSDFADYQLGKSVVVCADRPGFIANRIGTYWMHKAVTEAIQQNISVEAADAVMSRPIGVPKTGIFGLLDLVGLDLMPHVLSSLMNALDEDDAFNNIGQPPAFLEKMIADGYTGRKGKGGFYRLNDQRKKEVVDLETQTYGLAKRPKIAAAKAAKKGGLRALVTHDSPEGRYAWSVLSGTLSYAASLVGEIADDIETIDRAMRLGFNWKFGPFELIDKLGTAWFAEKIAADGCDVPEILKAANGQPFYRVKDGKLQQLDVKGKYKLVKRPKGVLLLQDIKRASKPIYRNNSASVWDIGNKVACLEFHSKMNSLNLFTLRAVRWVARELPKQGYKGLVIHNEGTNFSVGANIVMLLITAKLRLFPFIRWILKDGQGAFKELKYAPIPVVGAPSGMALGGGCEVLLHCDALTPHAETYTGLVEAGVGIIPGWGGCKEMLQRGATFLKAKGPMPAVAHAFQTIATAQVSKSAQEAKSLLFVRPDDDIVMNRDRILAAAKAKALSLAKGYNPPEPQDVVLPGASGETALRLAVNDFKLKGVATPHDVVIAKQLAHVLAGGKTDVTEVCTEEELLKLERKAFIRLCKTQGTRDRVLHMLRKGKPLRN